jgi:FlaA1/EpsC-like NDP-sugar epimerase
MTHSFSDQTVLIAGAGGNLGSAVAKKFLSSEAN